MKANMNAFLLVITAIAFAAPDARGDPRTLERFRAEAPSAWARLSELDLAYDGSVEHSEEDLLSKETESYVREFHVVGQWALFIDRFSGDSIAKQGDVTMEAYGTNSKYAFMIKQYRGSSGWVVENVQFHSSAGGELSKLARSGALWPVKSGTLLYQRHIDKLYGSPGFSLEEAMEVKRGDETLVAAHFTYLPDDTRRDMKIIKATTLLDPGRLWSVIEATLEIEWPSKEVGSASVFVSYDQSRAMATRGGDGQRIAPLKEYVAHVHATEAGTSAPPSTDFRVTSKFTTRPPSDGAEKPFTLSAFGLPEPREERDRVVRWWWVLAVGVVLLSLGYFLRRYTDREGVTCG